ncbi:hypothetical protein, partial [Oleiphilus sp. HI0061]|uniref:hypothetical protein n=1 Tax=Oleiphilus sp. HI0061 TaxID=1822239 RepID=UPI001E556DA2
IQVQARFYSKLLSKIFKTTTSLLKRVETLGTVKCKRSTRTDLLKNRLRPEHGLVVQTPEENLGTKYEFGRIVCFNGR